MELKLLEADRARDLIIAHRQNRITAIYREAANRVSEILSRNANISVGREVPEAVWNSIENEIAEIYNSTREQIARESVDGALETSRAATDAFSNFLIVNGYPSGKYFQAVPRSVVESIANGTVYQQKDNLGYRASNWGLSRSIWGSNSRTIKDIHGIISRGVANGDDTYSIAKRLEKYVTPGKLKPWDWSRADPFVRKTIDYNAQRLVRTIINHAYQQTFKEMGKYNPWIEYYVWHSVFAHGRTCQVCMDMDGNHYAKEGDESSDLPNMPLDHPNGLCYFTYEMDTETMVDDLAKWVNSPVGTYRDIDRYDSYLKER